MVIEILNEPKARPIHIPLIPKKVNDNKYDKTTLNTLPIIAIVEGTSVLPRPLKVAEQTYSIQIKICIKANILK